MEQISFMDLTDMLYQAWLAGHDSHRDGRYYSPYDTEKYSEWKKTRDEGSKK